MDDFHWYYDFRINGDHVGSYEIRLAGREIYQNPRFRVEGELSVNDYWLKVDSGTVTAFKSTETPRWTSMERYGPNAYPTSAYLLLLAKLDDKLDYVPIDEGTLDVGDRLTLVRKSDTVGAVRSL